MTRHHFWFFLGSLSACGHDLGALAPDINDVPSWLPEQAAPECVACIQGSCRSEVEACIADPSCNGVYHECYPPNPSCGLGAQVNRDLAMRKASSHVRLT